MIAGQRVVFRAPGQAALEPFEVDETALGPTEVVVRTEVSLISPGTELANLQGKLGMHSDAPREYPMTGVGYANVGRVVAAGAQASARRRGESSNALTRAPLAWKTWAARLPISPCPTTATASPPRATVVRIVVIETVASRAKTACSEGRPSGIGTQSRSAVSTRATELWVDIV